jgi:hypothetical protein
MGRRRRLTTAASLGFATAALAGCTLLSGGGGEDSAQAAATGPGLSWAPAPLTEAGMQVLADADGTRFALHTASGDKTFLPGVNLGSTTPPHHRDELAVGAEDYRRWFVQMGDLGVRVVRVYTIHPPAFYDELASYNRAKPDRPLYLVQGIYLPDESYAEGVGTLYDGRVDRAFAAEIADASAAVHGQLARAPQPGRASGIWTTDVSAWLTAWIVGVEWDPHGVTRTDQRHRHAPYTAGRFFTAAADATPTERWLARHLDALAAAEAVHGDSAPIAFTNWPTVDPLDHPDEPDPGEDQVGVDANHVVATDAWPAGTFASYHAYPYYPDFLRHEEQLWHSEYDGRRDPYAGYLRRLREHHATMPVMVTEFGVPSSLGSAHEGPLGRNQGGHSEQTAMQVDADLLRLIHAQGMAGGLVFAWTDEWFKRTWNTMRHQAPAERRQLWHDPLTNEQYFGLVATDPGPVPDGGAELTSPTGPLAQVRAQADASYLHLEVAFRDDVPAHLRVSSDTVSSPAGDDYRIDLDLHDRTGQVWVREELDPVRLDTAAEQYVPDVGEPWHRYRLLTKRRTVLGSTVLPAETQDVGELVEGSWDPAERGYDSRATWQVAEPEQLVRLRVPWAMLGLSDPSSRTALGEGRPAVVEVVERLGLTFEADGERVAMDYTWSPWNYVDHTERLKSGVDVLAEAFRELGR